MRDFMTPILVLLTCLGDQQAKGILFQSTYNLCRESNKTQVWLCFLVLSFLGTFLGSCAVSVAETADVQICLERLKHSIEKSDAMLYAPSANDVEGSCKIMTLKCYMLELIMVINEEQIMDNYAECISDFNSTLPAANSAGCPPCEAYSLKNTTIFLERLSSLLEEMTELRANST